MQQQHRGRQIALSAMVLSLVLVACGGGGGGGSEAIAGSSASSTSSASSASSPSSTSSSSSSSSSNSTSSNSSVSSGSSSSSSAASSGYAGAPSAVSGGFATATGGAGADSVKVSAANKEEIQAAITAAAGKYPVHITYTGNEDALINQIVAGHTVGADGTCPNPRWDDEYRKVEIKGITSGVTIEGADGSSANFGIVINGGSSNVIVRNMKIGALGGAKNDADMIRIDSGSNVWIDHNELFAVNNECKGSPDGDLTFESAIDIKKASHNITVSYNYIHDVKKVGLDGSSSTDIDGGREITFHHNHYKNVNARLPLQRGGWVHLYNNLYDGITGSGINVRRGGYALVESNWFQNALNPVVCFYDKGVECGYWELKNNNISSPADFAAHKITWGSGDDAADITASAWTSTGTFPVAKLTYSYAPDAVTCVKAGLPSVAGVGKGLATLKCN